MNLMIHEIYNALKANPSITDFLSESQIKMYQSAYASRDGPVKEKRIWETLFRSSSNW